MRVTNRYLYYQLVRDIGNVSEKMITLNSQISSGKRINKPSDDPLGTATVLSSRSELNAFDQFSSNIDYGNGWLTSTETVLQEVDDLLARATELATSQSSVTATADTRIGAAEEVSEILDQVLSLANSKYGNKYMFGGTMTQTTPFLDLDVSSWEDDVSTIAATPPAGAVAGDRYIDTDDNHIWSYDGTTWSDLGESTEGTAVMVNDQNDEIYVYSASEGWSKQYQGNDDSFSIKIGKTDTVQVNLSGTDVFNNEDGNVVQTLMQLEQALRNNDTEGISGSLTGLLDSSEVISNNLALVGARMNRFDYTDTALQNAELNTTERMSEIEDLDYAEAILALQNQQVIYQATLQSASMITSLSLVDYIS
jgi:flagellar hook-associated protein 3 FlgL